MAEKKLKFPFTWRTLTEDEKAERRALYQHPATVCGEDVIVSQPENLVFPKQFADIAEDIYNMDLRPDDIWVVTHPRCGTTWTQEMTWQIVHNFDVEGGKVNLNFRCPYLEMQMWVDPEADTPENLQKMNKELRISDSFDYVQSLPSPRCIKSHLPLQMLPPRLLDTCKVIAVTRNPKDCCVSMYNLEKIFPLQGYTGDFASYARLFKEGKLVTGGYWYFMKEAWKQRNHPNMRLLWFEDMKKDLQSIIRDLSKFLGYHLTELKILQLDDHLYFDNFKKNPAVNYDELEDKESGGAFMRKGKVGDWKNFFTEEAVYEWNLWIEENKKKHDIQHDNLSLA